MPGSEQEADRDTHMNDKQESRDTHTWCVWYVIGFGVEENDDRAADAIRAGENVTILFPRGDDNA